MDEYLDQFMEDHLTYGYGSILDELNAADQHGDDYPDCEPWDDALEQQELEDFEQADEYFGFFGGDDEW